MSEVSADQLQQAVESQHGGRAALVAAEPVKEVFNGKTVLHLGGIRSPLVAVRAAIVAGRRAAR